MPDTQVAQDQDLEAPLAEEQQQQMWKDLAAERAAKTPNYSLDPDAPAPVAATPAEPPAPPAIAPELKEVLDKVGGLQAVIDKLTHEVSSSSGRVAAIQREMAVSQSAAAAAAGRAPNQQAVKAASKSLDKWDQLKNDFPDWAAAIEERVGAEPAPAAAAVDLSQLQEQLQREIGSVREAVILGVEEAKIYGAYRHWRTEVKTDPFKAWFNAQPDAIKSLAGSTNADDVIGVLDKWETSKVDATRDVAKERAARLAAAAGNPRRAAPTAPLRDGEKSADQIWEEEKQARLAKRAGR